jgi:uncharacterized membrane protein
MYKSLFRDTNSLVGRLKYVHYDIKQTVSGNGPNYFLNLGYPDIPLAQSLEESATKVSTNVVAIKAMKIRLCFILTDTASANLSQREIPVRIDTLQEEQTAALQVVTRATAPYTNFYLRKNVGDTDHELDITSTVNAPLNNTAKGFAKVINQYVTYMPSQQSAITNDKHYNPVQFMDIEFECDGFFEIPGEYIELGTVNPIDCVGRLISVYLTWTDSLPKPAYATAGYNFQVRGTISYAFSELGNINTYA